MGSALHSGLAIKVPAGQLEDWGDPPVTANMLARWDAFDLDSFTFDSDDLVSAWTDQVSGLVATVQASLKMALTCMPSLVEGVPLRPALFFPGDRYLSVPSGIAWGADCSSYVAIVLGTAANYRTLLRTAASGNQWLIDSNRNLTTAKEGSAFIGTQTNAAVTLQRKTIVGQVSDNTAITHYVNLTDETDAHGNEPLDGSLLNIGASGGTNFFLGMIGEVLLYNAVHNVATAESIIAYLMEKWGV